MDRIIDKSNLNNMGFVNARILVLFIKFLIFLINIIVVVKPVRIKIRKKLFSLINKIFLKEVKKEIKNIRSKYSDYYIFSLFFPLGDLGIACSLMKIFKNKNNKKILVIVNDKNRARVASLFPSIDKIMIVHPFVYDYIYNNPEFKIKKGRIYEINHWKFYDAPKYKSKNFLELYAHMLGLKEWENFESPVFSEMLVDNVMKIIEKKHIDIRKTVFIAKDSNSFNCKLIDENFWINKAKYYKNMGYEVVFNSKKKSFQGYKTIFLPMHEQLYFCSLCKKVVAIRSGFNDLLGLMKLDNLEIYYPKTMFFGSIKKIDQLCEFKRAFFDDESKNFNENMYRITSLNMFNLKHVEEYIL